MEDKKMDWSKPLLVELEKATYTVGTCANGTNNVPGNPYTCHTGKLDSAACADGGAAAGGTGCGTGIGGAV